MTYSKKVSRKIESKDMVKNNAGGMSFLLDKWKGLERFLILGAESGTFYLGEQEHVENNYDKVIECIKEDPYKVAGIIKNISESGRAAKQEQTFFCLALLSIHCPEACYHVLNSCLRTGTHVFQFMKNVNDLRGFGTGMRKALSNFVDKPVESVAFQMCKYSNREGFSWRDYLRIVRPKAKTDAHNALFRYVVAGSNKNYEIEREVKGKGKIPNRNYSGINKDLIPPIVFITEEARTCTDEKKLVKLIIDNKLTHEMVNNDMKKSPKVWEALLENMPPEAMLRNLGRMTNIGLISPLAEATKKVYNTFTQEHLIKKARLHPLKILIALKTYAQGRGDFGDLTWVPVQRVIDAVDAGFYSSFKYLEPTNKKFLLCNDISGSMDSPCVAGKRKNRRGNGWNSFYR